MAQSGTPAHPRRAAEAAARRRPAVRGMGTPPSRDDEAPWGAAASSALSDCRATRLAHRLDAASWRGACASRPRTARGARLFFGLLTAAAMGVHVSGGVTEAHFSSSSWWSCSPSTRTGRVRAGGLYTLLHHGLLGHRPEDVFVPTRKPVGLGGDPRGLRGGRRRGRGRGVAAQRGRRRRCARPRRTAHAAMTDSLTGLPNRRSSWTTSRRWRTTRRARAVRPRRLQGLQRHLRPPGRRCPAHAPRPPAPRDRGRDRGRHGLPAGRRRVLRAGTGTRPP